MDSEQRREAVVEAIRVGAVPREPALKVWAGVGTGKCCAVCGARLRAGDIEFELEFASGVSVVVDRQCHSLWNEERTRA